MARVEDFFRELDSLWDRSAPEKIELKLIGSAALMVQFGYERGTKDCDILQTLELTSPVQRRLVELAGENTELHERRRMYLDIVANGIPFLPSPSIWRPLDQLSDLVHFELRALDVVDVVVSKLKRFNANDRHDVAAMVDAGRVPHEAMLGRFRSAFHAFSYDARAADLAKYTTNLHQVERDFFEAEETDFSAELDGLRY